MPIPFMLTDNNTFIQSSLWAHRSMLWEEKQWTSMNDWNHDLSVLSSKVRHYHNWVIQIETNRFCDAIIVPHQFGFIPHGWIGILLVNIKQQCILPIGKEQRPICEVYQTGSKISRKRDHVGGFITKDFSGKAMLSSHSEEQYTNWAVRTFWILKIFFTTPKAVEDAS